MNERIISALKRTFYLFLTSFILRDYFLFKEKAKAIKEERFELSGKNFYPQVKDKTLKTGFDRHYVYHTSWAARKVKEINPIKHLDIGSSLYFSGVVSAFVPIDFYDYRPADINLSNLESMEGNLLSLPFADSSIDSLSCMHTIEHIGLGRYGDPIDPDGDIKAIKELKRVVALNGSLLFVVPIGRKAIIEFNAHRIYTYNQIIELFSDMKLKEFSLIPEHGKEGGLIINANPELTKKEHYACGCFWFQK